MPLRNAAEAKAELARMGVTIPQWARANGLDPQIVYQVLAGLNKANRGEGHRAAVLLGIKDGVIVNPSEVKDALRKSA